MTILEEIRNLLQEKIGRDYDVRVVEKVVIGLFFKEVKLSTGQNARGYCESVSNQPGNVSDQLIDSIDNPAVWRSQQG